MEKSNKAFSVLAILILILAVAGILAGYRVGHRLGYREGAKERGKQEPEPIVYRVADIVAFYANDPDTGRPNLVGANDPGAVGDYDSMIDTITSSVSPETWEDVGGRGVIAPFPAGQSLVISQTPQVHEEIGQLLNQLRDETKSGKPEMLD